MPGVPLDVMDKLKAIFKRKPKGTAGTQTETPKTSDTAPAVPATGQTPLSTPAPSSSDPTAPPAGAVPVDAPTVDKPTTTPTPVTSDPVAPAAETTKPQVSEATSVAAR